MMLLPLLALLAAASPEADIAAWIAAQGGSVTTDSAGRITAVNLRASWVTDADLARLTRLPQLHSLDLSHTHISDLGMEQLKPLSGIVALNLCYAEHVTDEGLAHLRGWKKLERLNVRGTKITDTGLEHLSMVQSLTDLDAGFAEITNNGLDHLANLPGLKRLAIGGNKTSDSGLSFLKQIPGLTHLDLSGSQRTDSGLWFVTLTDAGLDAIAPLVQLQELNLAGSKITDLGLAKLRSLTRLRSLDLSRTQVTAKGLAELQGLANLSYLNLWKAPRVGDDALAVLRALPALGRADLEGTAVTRPLR